MATVTANNTRIDDAEDIVGWDSIGSGQGGSIEGSFFFQGSLLYNRKVTDSAGAGGAYLPSSDGGFPIDMSPGLRKAFLVKCVVTDYGGLQTTNGVQVRLGSGTAAYHEYIVGGSLAPIPSLKSYPPKGGFVITAIDPSVAGYRNATAGTPDLAAIGYYGVAAAFVNSSAKSENVGVDAIDVGTGLTVIGPTADFRSFLDFDEGDTLNRFGYVTSSSGVITILGMMTVGDASGSLSTQFSDATSRVLFLDGYFAKGFSGVHVNLNNAADDVSLLNNIDGTGSVDIEDTRPDLTVQGASGSMVIGGALSNFGDITLTAAVVVSNGASLGCVTLAGGGSSIGEASILTASTANNACVPDLADHNLVGTTFSQEGTGHAIRIATAGSYTLDAVSFNGYGATDAGSNPNAGTGLSDACILNDATGVTTINVLNGGDTPTVRNAAGATTIVNNTVGLSVTALFGGTGLAGARVRLSTEAGGPSAENIVVLAGVTDAQGKVAITDYAYLGDQPVQGRVRKATGSPYFKTADVVGTITATGLEITAVMVRDD
jgi:hypothetical protein